MPSSYDAILKHFPDEVVNSIERLDHIAALKSVPLNVCVYQKEQQHVLDLPPDLAKVWAEIRRNLAKIEKTTPRCFGITPDTKPDQNRTSVAVVKGSVHPVRPRSLLEDVPDLHPPIPLRNPRRRKRRLGTAENAQSAETDGLVIP